MATPHGTVYVIDDDESVRKALEKLLRSEGFAVETFSSVYTFIAGGKKGYRGCILVGSATPSLELLTLYVASNRKKVPVIVLSASDRRSIRREAREPGAASFCSKPVDTQALLDHVLRAIEGEPEEQ